MSGGDAALLEELVRMARDAARIVMDGYARQVHVQYKSPGDPVTEVDRAANAEIVAALARVAPGVPVVAEESDPSTFAAREGAAETFFVDPLDGTRDFIAHNGEFAVMIGLARAGRAALGVVDCPAMGRVFAGGPGAGAFEIAADGSRRPLRASPEADPSRARAVVSRSRASPETLDALARLGITDVRRVGSAGIKVALVAAGEAEIYLHLGRAGSLWDACAPGAIAAGAGALLSDTRGAPVDYARGTIDLLGGTLVTTPALRPAVLAALGG